MRKKKLALWMTVGLGAMLLLASGVEFGNRLEIVQARYELRRLAQKLEEMENHPVDRFPDGPIPSIYFDDSDSVVFGDHCAFPLQPDEPRCRWPAGYPKIVDARQIVDAGGPVVDCVRLFQVGPRALSVSESRQCIQLLFGRRED